MARSQGSGRTKSLGMGILGMADMVTGDGRYERIDWRVAVRGSCASERAAERSIRALKKEERRARDEGFAQPRLMLVIPFDYYSSL
jgi:hypothetical protein